MKTSEGFRLARARVAGGVEFICHALDYVGAPIDCKALISERMGFGGGLRMSLESWLQNEHGIDVFELCAGKPEKQMRLYRLRWLDSLIAEFEAKGD